jgi:hypothetical protein
MVRDAQHGFDLGGGLNGDPDVFTSQGFRIGTIDPFAGISPEFGSGICSVTCRLTILSSLLNENPIHVLVLPEATVSRGTAASVKRFVSKMIPGTTAASAPTSSTASITTESYIHIADTDKQTRIKRGAVTVLVSPAMTPFFRSAPQPFGAGRGLHLTFDLPDGALHIIALYGVSAASSTPQKILYEFPKN